MTTQTANPAATAQTDAATGPALDYSVTPIAAARPGGDTPNAANDRAQGPNAGAGAGKPGAGRKGPGGGDGAQKSAVVVPIAPPARAAKMRKRHYGVFVLAFLMIVVPTVVSAWYLWTRAIDQYESRVGFAIRNEEIASPFELLGALGVSSSSSANDSDILYEFIHSQQMVEDLDQKLDLRALFSRPQENPLWSGDPLMTLDPDGSIEDLVDFWKRMVQINYDGSTRLIEIRVFAFDPQDARKIATAVLEQSGAMINKLSNVAREDSTRFSKEALLAAETRLATARSAVTEFRINNQIFDPTADIASQSGLLSTLNQQLASALIESDMLADSASAADPRQAQALRKIEVIQQRIEDERRKVGAGAAGDVNGFAKLYGEYERLAVNQEFAEKSYLSALASYDAASADAQLKSRYLAAYVEPTLAEAPTAPNRPLLLTLVAALAFFAWAIMVLMYYALRDRR